MLRAAKRCSELEFSELLAVYAGTKQDEREFYSYLQESFFRTPGACYAIWEENGQYISALRLEPYEDGVLLAGLETRPEYRCRGYATRLVQAVLTMETGKIYSHVEKKNIASLRTHEKCGFRKISDCAHYIDGSVSANAVTLCR